MVQLWASWRMVFFYFQESSVCSGFQEIDEIKENTRKTKKQLKAIQVRSEQIKKIGFFDFRMYSCFRFYCSDVFIIPLQVPFYQYL